MKTELLIKQITKALSFKYPKDKWMPGVTISFLRNQDFYVSLVRHCPDKRVILKTSHPDLDQALLKMAIELVAYDDVGRTPVDELKSLVSASQREERLNELTSMTQVKAKAPPTSYVWDATGDEMDEDWDDVSFPQYDPYDPYDGF